MKRIVSYGLAGGLVWLAGVAPSGAQVDSREGIALQNQIAELRQEMQALQQGRDQGGGAPAYAPQGYVPQQPGGGVGDTAAELVVRVGTLEEQNRQLQGRVDDLSNQLQRQHDELAKQIGDLAFKLGQGGAPAPDAGQNAAQPSGAQPNLGQSDAAQLGAAPPPRAATGAPRRTPELALREANAAMLRHDYAGAVTAAREAMASGRGATASSAQFVIARAEGGQHQFKEAAADFYQAYNRAPKSPAAPVALLGVANSLIAMGDNRDACQALAKLTAEFPGAAGVKAGVAGARKRAACGR